MFVFPGTWMTCCQHVPGRVQVLFWFRASGFSSFVCVSRQSETSSLYTLDRAKLLPCVLCFPAVLITRGARGIVMLLRSRVSSHHPQRYLTLPSSELALLSPHRGWILHLWLCGWKVNPVHLYKLSRCHCWSIVHILWNEICGLLEWSKVLASMQQQHSDHKHDSAFY